MDVLSQFALSALDNAVNDLLTVAVPNGVNRQLSIIPSQIKPAGLGGYLGAHAEPSGPILARRIIATLDLSVSQGSDSSASTYLNQQLRVLLTQDRGDLQRAGFYKIKLDPERSEALNARFNVDFEYRHLPTDPGGIIETLDLGLDLNATPYKARFVWDVDTASLRSEAEPLREFAIADDPHLSPTSPASNWQFDQANGWIAQSGAARGGSRTLSNARKAGAQLLWRPNANPLRLSRFIASMRFQSDSHDGIGLVFSRKDDNNFSFFLASHRHRYQMFGSKRDGVYDFIGAPAEELEMLPGQPHQLEIICFDKTLIAVLDGRQTLQVEGQDESEPGEIGFLTHVNDQAHFLRARLVDLY